MNLKPYMGIMGAVFFATFLCSVAFVFTQAFITMAVASGFTRPPLPHWARMAIWEWVFGIPQETLYGDPAEYLGNGGPDAVLPRPGKGGGGGSGGGGTMWYNIQLYDQSGKSQLNSRGLNYDWQAVIDNVYFLYDETGHTTVDMYALERYRGRTGISGLDFYSWYAFLYNNKDGWWWEMFGQDEDGFTVYDAMGVIMYYEAQLQWDNPYLGEAAVRKANSYCENVFGHPCQTDEEFINWFAAHNQSAGNHFRDPNYPKDDYTQIMTEADVEGLRVLVETFKTRPEEWNDGCTGSTYALSRPCGWANASYFQGRGLLKMAENPQALYTYEGGGDPWIIPSGCVWAFWAGGSSVRNTAVVCPNVRP